MKKILKSDFLKSFLTLFTGTALSQIIPILASFILTRLYDEYDFGALEFFLKIQSFLVVVATLRYDFAVPLPKSDKHAFNLLSFSMRFNLIFLVICQVIVVILYLLNELLAWEINHFWVYLFLPITVFFLALNEQFDYWFTRKKWYKNITVSRVTRALLNNGTKIVLGIFNWSFTGLIAGNIVGAFSSCLAFFSKYRKHREVYQGFKSKKQQRVLLKKYSDFPMVTMPHALTDMTRDLIFIAALSTFYGLEVLGAFALTLRILRAPISFVGSALGQVFFQKVSTHVAHNEPIYQLTKRTTLQLFGLSLIPFVILGLWGTEIFAFLFGKNWGESGLYARIMVPWIFIQFVSSPLSRIPAVLKKQKQFFILSVSLSILYILSLTIGHYYYVESSFPVVLFWITMIQFFGLIIIIISILRMSKKYDNQLAL